MSEAPRNLKALPYLARRGHVRVVLPAGAPTYATVQRRGRAGDGYRGLVSDISAGGMAMRLLDSVGEPLGEREQVMGRIEHGGVSATVAGEVVRSSRNALSLRFLSSGAELFNLQLITLVMRIVTRKVEYVDRGASGVALRHALTHKHFYGAGYLDVRVQRESPRWWQLVFLEYMASWSQEHGFSTGIVDRSFQVSGTLQMTVNVSRDPTPQIPIQILALKIVQRCQQYQPNHTADFLFMQQTMAQHAAAPQPG